MPAWGKLDSKQLTANVKVVNGSAIVANATGNATTFLTEVNPGDYFVFGAVTGNSNVKYYVTSVDSNVQVTLSTTYLGANASGKANVQQGPNYISNVIAGFTNPYDIQDVYGVDLVEAAVSDNKKRGINQPGWTQYRTYTDTYGQTRHKAETLVAMSKNFNRDTTTGNLFTDASDAAVLSNGRVYFTGQPANVTVSNANLAISFTATAVADPTLFTLTYKWQNSTDDISYVDVPNTGIYSGNTTTTLSLANTINMTGNIYRVVVTGTYNNRTLTNTSIGAYIL